MATSYTINSPHYEGAPSVRDSHKIPISPEKIKSMQSLSIGPHLINGKVVMRTANNIYTDTPEGYLKNGYFSQIDDGVSRGTYQFPTFDDWDASGKKNPPSKHNLITTMPNIAYIQRITSNPLDVAIEDTPVNLDTTRMLVNAIHPNEVGRYISKVGKLEHDLRNLLWNDVYIPNSLPVKWIEYLDKKGYSIGTSKNAEIMHLGIEKDVEKEGYVAFYYPRKGILGVEEDFHNRVKNVMSRYGLTDREAIKAMKEADLLHEMAHRLGVKSELLQGLFRAEFYSQLAENYKGTEKEIIYKAVAKEGIDYAREYSPWKRFWDEITAESFPKKEKGPIDLLVAKFEKESDELELRGERRELYINNRMVETYGELLREEPSYKSEKLESKESREKSLEERVSDLKKVGARAEKSEGSRYEKAEKTYEEAHEGKIDTSEYNSMSDAEKVVKEANEATPEAEMDGMESANAKPSAKNSETADG